MGKPRPSVTWCVREGPRCGPIRFPPFTEQSGTGEAAQSLPRPQGALVEKSKDLCSLPSPDALRS